MPDDGDSRARGAAPRAKRALRWLFGFLCLLVLLTHTPSPLPRGAEPRHWDKLVHFGLYATLSGLAMRALASRCDVQANGTVTCMRCAAVVFCVVAFGLLDEATQPLTGRDFDWYDWLADAVGAISGTIGYEVARRRYLRSRKTA